MARRPATTKPRPKAIAFAGPGDSTIDNTTDLLNDFLGFKDGEVPEDDDTLIYLPATKGHLSKGMESVIDWTDDLELAYCVVTNGDRSKTIDHLLENADEVEETDNVNVTLIDALRSNEDHDQYLILLYGEEGDMNAEVLLGLAGTYGIKALDLTEGLDDLEFEEIEEQEPEPAKDPEPEPEKTSRRRGRAREIEPEEKPLADEAEDKSPPWPVDEEPEEKAAPARRTRTKKAEEIGPTPEGEPTLQEHIAESQARAVNTDEPVGVDFSPEILHRFEFRQSGSTHAKDHERLRLATMIYAQFLMGLPEGREKSLALTKVEEALFWANAAIARQTPVQSAAEEASEEPKRGRGRPRKDGEPTRTRSAAEKAVKEIWDEEDQAWVRAGRGRIPSGVKTRLVDPKTGEPVEDN